MSNLASSRLRLIPFEQLKAIVTRNYVVKGWIPAAGLTVLWGLAKCGKSFLAIELAIHVALGWNWRGRRVKQGPVVYIACEGAHGVRARIEAFRKERLEPDVSDVPFFLEDVSIDLVREHQDLMDLIRQEVKLGDPVLIVIDTLNRSLNGSEILDKDMGDYIRAADALREAFECAILVVHHCGIDAKRPRGHTSLTAAADAQIAVKRSKATDRIIAKLEFLKDGPEGEVITSELRVVQVGTDEDGDPITSCVLDPVENEQAGASAPYVTGQARDAFDLLRKAIDEEGRSPAPNSHARGRVRSVPMSVWRDRWKAVREEIGDKPDNVKKSFQRARDRLQKLGFIIIREDEVWVNDEKGTSGTFGDIKDKCPRQPAGTDRDTPS